MTTGYSKTGIIGNLGQDPDVRRTPEGTAITKFSVAVNEKWRDRNSGQQKERTDWFTVVVFGKLAEVAGDYLKKGSSVFIEGQMRSRSYEQDSVKRTVWELHGKEMRMLDRKPVAPTQHQPKQQVVGSDVAPGSDEIAFSDDIPF